MARKLLLGWVLLGVGVLGFPLASHVAASHWSQSTGTEAEPVLQASLFGEPRRQDSRPAVPDIDTPNPEQEAAAVRAASDFLKQPGLLDTARGRFDIETVGSISDESGLIAGKNQ